MLLPAWKNTRGWGGGGAHEEAGGSSGRLGNKELVMDQAMGVSKTGKTDRSGEICELEF